MGGLTFEAPGPFAAAAAAADATAAAAAAVRPSILSCSSRLSRPAAYPTVQRFRHKRVSRHVDCWLSRARKGRGGGKATIVKKPDDVAVCLLSKHSLLVYNSVSRILSTS